MSGPGMPDGSALEATYVAGLRSLEGFRASSKKIKGSKTGTNLVAGRNER